MRLPETDENMTEGMLSTGSARVHVAEAFTELSRPREEEEVDELAAVCERTLRELSDLLGTWRLHIKPEILTALQSIKSWKGIRIKRAVL
jgi:hypothetical protein